jgi:hypothetical protein
VTVFDAVNGQAAAWDLHVSSDDPRSGASVDQQLSQMESLFRQWGPQTTFKCVIFEENGVRHDQQRALGHTLTPNADRRHSDFVLADCPANACKRSAHGQAHSMQRARNSSAPSPPTLIPSSA